jgi:uncharacterized coiled-coil protein SlyX
MGKGIPMETVFEKDEDTSEDTGTPMSDVETMTDEEISKRLDSGKASQKTEEPKKEEVEEAPVEEPEAPKEEPELEKLKKQVAEKEAFIQRQAQELGEYRKKAATPPAPPHVVKKPEDDVTPLDIIDSKDKFDQYIDRRFERRLKDMEDKANQFTAQQKQQIETTRQFINAQHPDFEKHIDAMAELAKEMGETPERIAVFKQNPYVVPALNLRLLYKAATKEASAQTQATPAPKAKVQSGAIKAKVGGGSAMRGGVEVPADLSMEQIGDLSYDTLTETLKRRMANEFKGR